MAIKIKESPDIRVVIVTGAGDRAFTAGMDLKMIAGGGGKYRRRMRWLRGSSTFRAGATRRCDCSGRPCGSRRRWRRGTWRPGPSGFAWGGTLILNGPDLAIPPRKDSAARSSFSGTENRVELVDDRISGESNGSAD